MPGALLYDSEFKESEMSNSTDLRDQPWVQFVFQHTDSYRALIEFRWSNQ